MKKLIISIFLTSLSITFAFAQFNKGNILVGGTTGLSGSFTTSKTKNGSSTTTNGKFSSFSIQPQAGYFVMDNLAVGLGLSFATSSFKDDGSSDKSSSTGIGLTPFVRYYFDKFFAQGAFGFGSNKSKNTFNNTTTESTQNTTNWSISGGYVIFLNDAIALEPQIGYSYFSQKSKGSNTKGINAGISFGVGVIGYINRK
ncbi:MAG TPA: autotransporter domain-containing protein [Cyclobacteriaceae bacterium]|nr:autotransporter domain-containing protein [Cyclobacteriaceae bacterium]